MPKNLLSLCLLISMLWICAFVTGDTDMQTVTQNLEKFRKNFPQEKIYLQLDKPYYSIGDTIYYKAYLVNAEKHIPSVTSNIIYADMIDDNNKIQKSLLIPVTDGLAWGTIVLNDSLPQGSYQLRAYTNWMRNFDEAFFFSQPVHIGNALTNDIGMYVNCNLDSINNNIIANVNYTCNDDKQVEAKEVSYIVRLNNKDISKGKAITNNEGKLNIKLPQLQKNQSYELVTRIKTDGKSVQTKTATLHIPAAAHTLQFFPESGQMLTGFPVRVGFKAVSNTGLGLEVSGSIADETGKQVASLTSEFKGIGSFTFTPQPGHTYYAFVKYKDGTKEKLALPKAAEEGYAMAIENKEDDKLILNIYAKPATTHNVAFVAQCNNRIQYAEELTLMDGRITVAISKKKLPTGITQFTLFDENMQPVAERLVFINQHDQLQINTTTDKFAYAKREHTQIALDVKDDQGNPVTGSFSLAVTSANSVSIDKLREQTILSNLLLTSDLKGYIEAPAYYFTEESTDKIKQLDNLLLTQGWRRFTWKDILANKYPATPFAIEKSLAVSGKVLTPKGEPVARGRVLLLSKKGNGFTLNTTTDSSGKFLFDELSFNDSTPFVVQAIAANGSNDVVIEMDKFSQPSVNSSSHAANMNYIQDSAMPAYLIQSRQKFNELRKNGLLNQNGFTLKEVTVTTQKFTKLQKAVAPSMNLNGPGNADQILTYEDLQNCTNLEQCLPSKALGVVVKGYIDPVTRHLSMQPFSTRRMSNTPMLIILDGVEMPTNSFSLSSIYGKDVQAVEILRSGGFLNVYGMRGSEGVLVITTKKGDLDYDNLDEALKQKNEAIKGTIFTTALGYSSAREFYSPTYAGPVSNTTMPDLRSTIYWNPNIITDDDGKATIEFYNADVTGKYNVVIEGISADGKIGSVSFSYEVK